jgi:flagellar hook-associated protein 3 FlgL
VGIRLVFDPYNTLLQDITQDRQRFNNALQQVASGQQLNSLSDNPAQAQSFVENKFEAGNLDQFTQNISGIQGSLQAADSALNAVGEALTSAISLATEGGSPTLSPSDRQALAAQANNLQQEILSLANSEFQGVYLFGGTDSTTTPYVQNGGSVNYVGNNNSNQVEIAQGIFVKTNLPGSTVFNAPGADVFQALQDLSSALQSGSTSDISTAASELNKAFSNVSVQRTYYGFALSQLQTTSKILTSESTQLTEQQNTLIAADPAQAITAMNQAQVTLDAALASAGRISQDSLLNYLPTP